MKLYLEIDISTVDNIENGTVMARVFYPDEGNRIIISKGLNAVECSTAIHHEIGHLLDWYLGHKNDSVEIREHNAETIGEALRWKETRNG